MGEDWKRKLAECLRNLGIIEKDYTGPIVVHCNSGGVNTVEKKVVLK